jgi:2-amino-4-hydroxy-6-hydroxymethyldihydropteridine diphosphokinase
LHSALELLRGPVSIDAISSLYETDPVGVTDQPAFLNIVVGGTTSLEPRQLLAAVKQIEREVGRRPTFRWGPRVVDVDILLLGDHTIDEADLTIPHRELANRAFVLVPLTEIAPDVTVPGLGLAVALRNQLDVTGVRLVGTLEDQSLKRSSSTGSPSL